MSEPGATPDRPAGNSESVAALLAVLDAYLADLQAGKAPDRAAVLAAHPELAGQLESCLAALDFIHRTERPDPALPPALGDFRVMCEIGRGAMGVVYEAEQVSLKRRVALKVLRFGAAADAEAMARFRREAETVAGLHHTNIVPIFAVGSEAGVHFFAMQLIAGRSLGAVLDEARTAGRLPGAKTVAGWGVQAAEALAHAHARGVVHRDVKPSNLLLDAEGTVWLTDFGLARRSDEATLTTAGVLLGTPRYMSPEQAAAVRSPVDQRSDVYSLGATLYELATGKPVFEAESVGQLVEQIAAAEPVPPRKHRPDLPRDLETVLLRCLAKDPTHRYPTARELADDLRRVVNGDPVKARRPGLVLRLRRWAGRRRKQALRVAGVTAVAVMATLVLFVAGQYWLRADREARNGSVTLQVDGGSGRGEIFGADGKLAVPAFTLPTQTPIELPGGWYRLRVIRPGLLSEDYELFIEQGQRRTFTVGSNDRQLWEPMPIEGTVAGDFGVLHIACEPGPPPPPEPGWAPVPPPAAVIIKRLGIPAGKSEEESRRWEKWAKNPFVPAVLWELRLKRQDHPALALLGDAEWKSFCQSLESFGHVGKEQRRSPGVRELIQPAPDLDGDGVGDLVFIFGRFVLAISGKEGKVLWCRELHSNLFVPEWERFRQRDATAPDTDKMLSLLLWGFSQSIPHLANPLPQWLYTETEATLAGPAFVVDVDGDGRPDLILAHSAFRDGPRNDHQHFDAYDIYFRPIVEALSGRTGATLWRHEPGSLAERLVVNTDEKGRRVKEEVRRGDLSSLWEPKPLSGVASLAERRTDKGPMLLAGLLPGLERLDLRTGQPVAPPDPPLWRKFRGGYEWLGARLAARRVLAWSADRKTAISEEFALFGEGGSGTIAIDTSNGEDVGKEYGRRSSRRVLADLYGDGLPQVVTTYGVDDGTGGELRWKPRLGNDDIDESQALLVGPDFDGDGCRDIFVARVFEGERFGHPRGSKVLVAGLRSGKDGRLLWLAAEPIPGGGDPNLLNRGTDIDGAVLYWRSAPGVAGHFVVNVNGAQGDIAFLFAADTGRLAHVWPGVTVEGIADLDGDGLLDLYGRRGDQLVTVSGSAPELWRRPGCWRWQWLRYSNDGYVRGHNYRTPIYLTGPIQDADLDGDGIADVLFIGPSESKCRAFSGRDGRLLWEWSWRDEKGGAPHDPGWIECLDLEGNRKPVVVVWGGSQCALLDGQTGKPRKQFSVEGNWVSPRPDLLYRRSDGGHALVYERMSLDGKGHVLVAVNAQGTELHEAPFPAADGKKELQPPDGFEFRPLLSLRLQSELSYSRGPFEPLWPGDDLLRRFGDWSDSKYEFVWRERMPGEERTWMRYPVGWRIDPSDSGLLRFYDISYKVWGDKIGMPGDERLTVLRKGIPSKPAREAPTRSYPNEVVFKRPLPWLERTYANALAGVGSVAAYLVLVVVLAAVGRRKTALLLLALFILLPANACAVGLFLVLALLVAALPRGNDRKQACLILLPGALLAYAVLGSPADLRWARQGRVWAYPAVLAPLIVLAAAGWKKTALSLLVPCLFLLLYLNWPSDDCWRKSGWPDECKQFLLDFTLLESPPAQPSSGRSDGPLFPYQAWDWSGWYWLWPNQMASWIQLKWALALVAGAELARRLYRQAEYQRLRI
jgi:tRNA A-37 threonylcarbamoyl transferase component Bud32